MDALENGTQNLIYYCLQLVSPTLAMNESKSTLCILSEFVSNGLTTHASSALSYLSIRVIATYLSCNLSPQEHFLLCCMKVFSISLISYCKNSVCLRDINLVSSNWFWSLIFSGRQGEGILFILWSLFWEQAEQVCKLHYSFILTSYAKFTLIWFLFMSILVARYVYKVCPFKQASQVEGHSTTRLG